MNEPNRGIDPLYRRRHRLAALIAATPCLAVLLTSGLLIPGLMSTLEISSYTWLVFTGACLLALLAGAGLFVGLRNTYLAPLQNSTPWLNSSQRMPHPALEQFLNAEQTSHRSRHSAEQTRQRESAAAAARLTRQLQIAQDQLAAVHHQQRSQQQIQARLRSYLFRLTANTLTKCHEAARSSNPDYLLLPSMLHPADTYLQSLQAIDNDAGNDLPDNGLGDRDSDYIALMALIDHVIALSSLTVDSAPAPLFLGGCNIYLLDDSNQITKPLFHYLLAWQCSRDPSQKAAATAETQLHVTVSNGTICCKLHPLPEPPHRRRMHQCAQLLGINDISTDTLMMRLAISNGTTAPARWTSDQRVFIDAENPNLHASLGSRLQQMGIALTEEITDADCLLIIGTTTVSARANAAALAGKNTLEKPAILHITQRNNAENSLGDLLHPPLQHDALATWLHRHLSLNNASPIILIADDDTGSRRLVSGLLQAQNCSVLEAKNGLEALQLTQHHSIDLVLMDLHMPVMDGVQAARKIRRICSAPLLAMTAYLEPGVHQVASAAGYCDVLIKPVSAQQLLHYLPGRANNTPAPTAATAPETPGAAPVFDLQRALRIANQRPELAREMLTLFIESLPSDRQTLRETFAANQRDRLFECLHRLRGACRYSGARRLQRALDTCPTGETAVKDMASALTRVDKEISALQRWHANNSDLFCNELSSNEF